MTRAHHREHSSEPCSPDCSYRRLYEGSQRSLNEMASLQAAALARAGRLRAGIVTVLRQHFPGPFAAAERESGRRVSEVDDELLLAYLSGFLQYQRSPAAALKAPAGPPPTSNPPASHPPASNSPAVAPDVVARAAAALSALGIDLPASDLAAWPAILAARPPGTTTADTPADNRSGTEAAQPPASSPHSAPGRPRLIPLEDLFDLEDFQAVPSRWEGNLGEADPTEGWSPSPLLASASLPSTPGAPPAVPPFLPRDSHPAPEVPATGGTSVSATAVDGPLRPQLLPTTPRRKAPRRQPGALRARATPAGESDLDVPAAQDADRPQLSSGLHDQLLAAVCLPRPVFVRDLVEAAGSREAVEEWESQCKADPARFPVRFVAAKSRHRLRGSLVLPVPPLLTASLGSSFWFRCVDAYRAARVYEMAVLLHRVAAEVVSADFGDHAAVLRLSTQRGLVGVVVVFEPDDDAASPGFAALRDAVTQLASERLSLLAVLTTAGEERAVPSLVAAASLAARQMEWPAAFPVIAARTWDYADDRGSSAVLVLDSPGQKHA